jgi:hypothetical protein
MAEVEPGSTSAVDPEVLETLGYPTLVPVTCTLIFLPAWAPVGTRVAPVAFGMVTPSANHRYDRVVPDDQEPGRTVRVEPIVGVPSIVGVETRSTGAVDTEVLETVA